MSRSQFEDSATYVYVNNAAHGLSDTNAESALAAGSGCFFVSGAGAEIDTAITAQTVPCWYAYKSAAGVITRSPKFLGTKIENAYSADTIARVEQVSYLGYNGTAGALDATAGYYSISIVLNHTFGLLNNSPLIKTLPYKLLTASQSSLAYGITEQGIKSFDPKREALRAVKFERINAGAQADAMGTATASVVNGGTQVVFSEDMTAIATDGAIVRFGTSGAGTAPCYIIASNDGGAAAARIYYLDVPYQGATNATFPAATLETVTEGNWGIKMTGNSVADADFKPVSEVPFVVDFDVALNARWSTATVTNSTASKVGLGTYQLVAADEAYAHFQMKGKQVEAYPPVPNHAFAATSGSAYNVIEFTASDSKFVSATTGINPISKFRVKIYMLDTTTDTDYGNFKTILGSTALTG